MDFMTKKWLNSKKLPERKGSYYGRQSNTIRGNSLSGCVVFVADTSQSEFCVAQEFLTKLNQAFNSAIKCFRQVVVKLTVKSLKAEFSRQQIEL